MPKLSLLPREVALDLKWLAWNELWAAVNCKLSGCGSDQELRERRRKQGEEDLKRAKLHYERVARAEALLAGTVAAFRAQVQALAQACGEAALEGRWLTAARAEAAETPEELETRTWLELVNGMKSAGVAVILLAHNEPVKAEALRRDFEDVWVKYSECSSLAD